ncbi:MULTISPECIES: hypothetical protein [Streptomyces violaceusniger group]|uniref:Amidohydrolase n=2 Tax=Streptomyces rhizosphaericus TaxID=114699 RepID=A0ABN1SM78_9ACTN|nr:MULTISPECIES: hypothetical protein [Streptomyces violaceusniger group]
MPPDVAGPAEHRNEEAMPLIAIEEHWIMPDVTSALRAAPLNDESLAFNG